MELYGFDCFLERGTLLQEMARPTALFNFVSPEFNALYDQLLKKQLADGVKDAGTRQIIVYRFIMDALNTVGDLYKDDDGPMDSMGLTRALGQKTNHAGYKEACKKLLMNHIDLANSPEVKSYLSDTNKMEEFKRNAGFSDDSSNHETSVGYEGGDDDIYDPDSMKNMRNTHGGSADIATGSYQNRRKGADNRSRELTGKGIVGNEQDRAFLRNIVLHLNKDMAVRRMKNNSQAQPSAKSTDTPELAYCRTIISALEELKIEKAQSANAHPSDFEGITLFKVPSDIVDALLTQYNDVLKGGGITPEEFEVKLGKLASKPNMLDSIKNFLVLLKDTVDIYSDASDSNQEDLTDTGSSFHGYDMDLVHKYAETPDVVSKLDTYLRNADAVRQDNLKRLENLHTKQMMDFALDQKLGTNNPQPEEQPEEDENVMGYMTEQVCKDIRTNPIGEFKYQNIKPAINSYHRSIL